MEDNKEYLGENEEKNTAEQAAENTEDTAKEAAEENAEDTAKEAAEENAQEATEEATEENAEDTAKEAAEENAEEAVEEAAEENAEEAAQEAVEEVSEEATEEAADELTEELGDETVAEQQEDATQGTEVLAGQEQSIVYREPLTERLCLRCGEKEKAEGSDYCEECETSMLTVKIPAGAWIAGFVVMLLSVVGFAISFLNCAAALQVTKGDIDAAENCWYNAYSAYSDVDSVAEQINDSVGDIKPVIVGEKVTVKKLVAMSHIYSPVDAGYSIEQNYPTIKGKYKVLAASEKAYEGYYAAYQACSDILDAFTGGTLTYEQTREKIDQAVKGAKLEEGYVQYIRFSVAKYAEVSDTELLELLKECEKLSPNYGWLYYTDLIDVYFALGDYNSAEKYCDKLIDENKNNGDAYYDKLMILFARNEKDEAFELCDEFDEDNPEHESTYTLRVAALRRFGDLEKAATLCQEGIDECQSVAEHYRQMAIIRILQGDYDAAFDAVYQANYMASSFYSYSGDSSMYTPELSDTSYLAAYLCSKYGKGTSENAASVTEFLDSFEAELDSISQDVKDIIAGTKTPEDVFMKGTGDVA